MKAHTLTRPLVIAVAALSLLALLMVSRGVPAEAAETITLKVADSFPTTHYVVNQATKPWMDRVVQLSTTKVVFEYYPSEQLGKANDMLNLVRSGVADIVYTSPGSNTGEFPLHGIVSLPGLYDSSTEGLTIIKELYKEAPLQEEWTKKGVQPLIVWALPNYEIFSTKAVIKVEDVKGLKLRSFGGALDWTIKALGGVPVSIPAADMYTALQRSTVDGVITPYTSAQSYKLEEICKYATLGARLSASTPVYCIRIDRLQKLPADVRNAMTKATEETVARVCKYQDDQVAQVVVDFEKKGVKINRLSKDDARLWQKALDPVTEQWIKQMETRGLPGKQVVDALRRVTGR